MRGYCRAPREGRVLRNKIGAHYAQSSQDIEEVWDNGIIVFDTKGLLDLLRYPSAIRDDFLALLEDVLERLWILHQVGAEFHRRRPPFSRPDPLISHR